MAGLEVYALHGWHGFTFDAVSRASGVGKPAIYRRWSTREELLADAFDQLDFPVARDLGSLRAEVMDYLRQWTEYYRSPVLPLAGTRILIDRVHNHELARLYNDTVIQRRGSAVRAITRRAVDRGELPEGTPATLLPDLLLGALFVHWAFAPDQRSTAFTQGLETYVTQLADTVIAGMR